MIHPISRQFLLEFGHFSFEKAAAKQIAKSIRKAVAESDGTFDTYRVFSAFLRAAHCGLTEVIKLFVKFDASLICTSRNGVTALSEAAVGGRVETVTYLIRAGAAVNHDCLQRKIPLLLAAQCGHEKVVSRILASCDVSVNKANERGETALYWAAKKGHEKVVSKLLAAHAIVDSADLDGKTSLYWAARNGHTRVVRQLIVANATIDQESIQGHTALCWAACGGHKEIVSLLLWANARIEERIYSVALSSVFPIIEKAAQWRRVVDLSLLLRPFELPVLVVHDIYKSLNSRNQTLSRYCLWELLKTLKRL